MMEKDGYLARFRKMLSFKLNLMGLNILSETFGASKMTFLVCASHVSVLIAVAAYLCERLEDLPSQQITELIVTFVLYFRLCTYLTSLLAMNLKWKSLIDRIDCERKCMDDDKEARQLSLIYSKKEFVCEVCFNIMSAICLVIVVCANAVVKTNQYRLPINFSIEFISIDDSSINWALNYLFQAVTMYFAALVFFGLCSLVLVVLNHSCWGIDMTKLQIEKINSSVGDDETPLDVSQREIIAKQLEAAYEMHLKALKWNEDVTNLTQINFFIEFSIFSVLICLCIFSIADQPFNSAYILLLLLVLLVQLFAFCWFGHRVLVRIDELSSAIYEIKWYLLDINHSKAIEMMLRASQNMRGFHGIFKPLSMETFQQVGACDFILNEVLEFSYSLLTLLRTMN